VTSPASYARSLRLVSGLRSLRRIRRLQTEEPTATGPVELHFRALGDAPVQVRPGKRDLRLAHEVFVKERNLPPGQLDPASVRTIWDLGASIGLTSAHFAARFPEARLIAVELDPAAAELCRRNVAAWADRCDVIHAWVSARDGAAGYSSNGEVAPAITLDSLLELSGAAGVVDHVRMDIAGGERQVLREGKRWAARVRSIKVEVHPPYTVDDCMEDLQRLGFATSSEGTAPRQVAGVRSQSMRTRASRAMPGAA
jgi:FkbM family methyltransferase